MPLKLSMKPILLFLVLAFLGNLLWPVSGEARRIRLSGNASSDSAPPCFVLFPWAALFSPYQSPVVQNSINSAATCAVPYELRSIAAQGGYLYVIYARNGFDIWEDAPIAETGLAIFNMYAGEGPQLAAQLALPVELSWKEGETPPEVAADEIVVEGDLAFIFQKSPALLWIVDLSDPADPQVLNALFPEEGVLTNVAIGECAAYIAINDGSGEESMVYALDLSTLGVAGTPAISPFFSLDGEVTALLAREGYLYLFAKSPGGGYVFDLHSDDPEIPCGFMNISGESAACRADRLYLVTGNAEVQSSLHVLNLANHDQTACQPEFQESTNLLGREKQVMTWNEYALVWKSSVFDTRHYLDIVDIKNPEDTPEKILTLQFKYRPLSLACGEDCLYVLDESGLGLLDLSNPQDPAWAGPFDLSSDLLSDYPVDTPIMVDPIMNAQDPMMDAPAPDTENITITPSLYSGVGFGYPWSFLLGHLFSPLDLLLQSKGYGPVATANSSLYGFPGGLGPWSGLYTYSSESSSSAYTRGPLNLLDDSDGSASSEYDPLTFPFFYFLDGSLADSLLPPLSISFY